MKDLFEPLDDEELDQLEEFLLGRVDEDAYVPGQDEGVLLVSELDGFLTAIVSGPVTVMPSRWFPALWGEFPPQWKDVDEMENILSLMVRHMNGIAGMLIHQPKEFEPMFEERVVKGKTYTIVDEWCEGYVRGLALSAEDWDAAGEEMASLLEPIYAFTSKTEWEGHDLATGAEIDTLRDAIAPNVRAIHAWWLAHRQG